MDNEAHVAFTIISADKFKPVPNKRNYLCTMFEAMDIPKTYQWGEENLGGRGIAAADVLIVPCNHNKMLFGKYTDKPIYVIGAGVDLEMFQYRERQFTLPFRFLWIAAPNPRKGYEVLTRAWEPFKNNNAVELYLKTTMGEGIDWEKMKQRFGVDVRVDGERPVARVGNVTWDGRDLSFEELRDLYYSANCFVFPTLGEGWGLTLSEAMATGLPCISTCHSGTADFFDDSVGLTIPWKIAPLNVYGVDTRIYLPQPVDTAKKMMYALTHYDHMLALARKARNRIEEKVTWDLSARKLLEAIEHEEARQEEARPQAATVAA